MDQIITYARANTLYTILELSFPTINDPNILLIIATYIKTWDTEILRKIAKNGSLPVIKWVRENGCPWDEWVCIYAAKCGYLDCLIWARDNGCPWGRVGMHLCRQCWAP